MSTQFLPAADEAAIAQAREAFRRDGVARLEPALYPGEAQALHDWLARDAEWWRMVNQGEKLFELGPEAQSALAADPARAKALDTAIRQGARDGFQFDYDSVRSAEGEAERKARDWPVDRLVSALNSPKWLAMLREITGAADVSFADGQATRYRPGHFLTAHDDEVAGKHRRAAYVLGLSPHWRTEWGGLLMFHRRDGDVERALLPRFNCMTLFAVPSLHSVSAVAPFAGGARLSVTGWLRATGQRA